MRGTTDLSLGPLSFHSPAHQNTCKGRREEESRERRGQERGLKGGEERGEERSGAGTD
jgi:hypothetical protein